MFVIFISDTSAHSEKKNQLLLIHIHIQVKLLLKSHY